MDANHQMSVKAPLCWIFALCIKSSWVDVCFCCIVHQENSFGSFAVGFIYAPRPRVEQAVDKWYDLDNDLLFLMTWCLWWALQQRAWSSAGDREPSAKLLVLFHLDYWIAAGPHDWGGETSNYTATAVLQVCICACLNECVILTPSTAHSNSALELWSSLMKDMCCFPQSSWPLKHHLHYKTLEKERGPVTSVFKISVTIPGLVWTLIKLP